MWREPTRYSMGGLPERDGPRNGRSSGPAHTATLAGLSPSGTRVSRSLRRHAGKLWCICGNCHTGHPHKNFPGSGAIYLVRRRRPEKRCTLISNVRCGVQNPHDRLYQIQTLFRSCFTLNETEARERTFPRDPDMVMMIFRLAP